MSRSKRSPKKLPENLPQLAETWHIVVRKLRMWYLDDEDRPTRPILLMILNLENEIVQQMQLFQAEPTPEEVLEWIHKAITQPMKGTRQKAHRPKEISFEEVDLKDSLSAELKKIGIGADQQDLSEIVNPIIDELHSSLRRNEFEYPGLLSVPGVTLDLVESIFKDAADFYRSAPWVFLADIQPLALQIPKTGTIYVQLMGNAGVEYGFLIYKNWDALLQMTAADDNPTENIPSEGWLSFNYNEANMVSFDDLDGIEEYGWEIADQQAYPMPVKYFPDRLERPTLDELRLFEAALQAIPVFVHEYLKPDGHGDYLPAEAEVTIKVQALPKQVKVKYPAGDLPKETLPAWRDRWLETDEDAEDDDWLEEDDFDEMLQFDSRVMEGQIADLLNLADDETKNPALVEAQQIMYEAWEEPNPARRINLAHKALFISPECTDAYVLLAEEEADTLQRALEYYRQGVEAGERALGKDFFKENTGHFWGILETRPYMRALSGLADCLWRIGETEAALRYYQSMLRLNPGDNLGIRYTLLHSLLELDRLEAVKKLMKQFSSDWSAEWIYTRALISFRDSGESDKAKRDLTRAFEQNPHVPTYLVGEKRIPNRMPEYIGFGDENEAIDYAAGNLNFWRRTPGAVDWIKKEFEIKKENKPPSKKSSKSRRSSSKGSKK